MWLSWKHFYVSNYGVYSSSGQMRNDRFKPNNGGQLGSAYFKIHDSCIFWTGAKRHTV